MNSKLKSFIALSLAVAFFQASPMESTRDVQNSSTQTQEQPTSRLSPKAKVVLGLVGTAVAVCGAYVAYMNRDALQDRFSRAYENCTWQEAEELRAMLQDGFMNGVVVAKDYAVDFACATQDVVVATKDRVFGFFSKPEVQETAATVAMVTLGTGVALTSSDN